MACSSNVVKTARSSNAARLSRSLSTHEHA